jgi:hypothetical protein
MEEKKEMEKEFEKMRMKKRNKIFDREDSVIEKPKIDRE